MIEESFSGFINKVNIVEESKLVKLGNEVNLSSIHSLQFVYLKLPMNGLEPRYSGIKSDRTVNSATTTAQSFDVNLYLFISDLPYYIK